MTATIDYDLPVRNLIDGLSATGHVTHTSYKKTMVTLHHNGGVGFSHQDILNIWKKRPASAHFDVDPAGAVAQYVKEHEYAWACANGEGNRTSISIEMANQSGAPDWLVSETTWKSAARLTGWLFAYVIKARPTAKNLVFHSHWYATACAGPYMSKIYPRVLAAAQAAYDAFTTGTPIAQEDDMSAEDVKQVNAYTRALLLDGYTVNGEDKPSLLAVLVETQRRVSRTEAGLTALATGLGPQVQEAVRQALSAEYDAKVELSPKPAAGV